MADRETILENEHFRLERLTDGIYAAIKKLKGGAMSNAGIVDLGGETVVFDAFLTRTAATELRVAAETLTGRPPRYLINSHAHGDHVGGNCVFLPEAAIVASTATAERLSLRADDTVEPAELTEYIERLERALAEETDERVRFDYEANPYPRRWLLEELPLDLALPSMAFDGRLEIRGSDRAVQLVVAGAHTDGDVVLLCPGDRILFLGDLGFFQDSPPYIAPEGDAGCWAERLFEYERLDFEHCVPGHGDVGGAQELAAQRGFLDAVVGAAQDAASIGGTVEDAIERLRATEYAKWEKTTLYEASIQSVLDSLQSEG
jgi:cyclase